MKNIKIRKANEKDFNQIAKLEMAWEKEHISWGVKHPSKKELLKHIKKDIVYVAENNQGLVGHIIGKINKAKKERDWAGIKKGTSYGYIDGIYIKKRYRNKEMGKLLIKKLLANFKDKKIKVVELKAVNKDLRRLVRFYEKVGFKEKMSDMVKRLR